MRSRPHAVTPLLILALVACAPAERTPAPATPGEVPGNVPPRVRVLGTVQDGGLPHPACTCRRCERARAGRSARRYVASLAIIVPGESPLLIDATPDLTAQLALLRDVRRPAAGRVDRAPAGGVLLTHAHVGHYLGLALFGYEAVSTTELPVYGTPAMLRFLERNEPWKLLVERGNIAPRPLPPGTPLELGGGVRVRPIAVPHRDELTDTVGFAIEGPRRRILYVPDTDGWERWDPPVETLLERFDVAILDGTFFSAEELPGRSVAEIGHPLIGASLERFGPLVKRGAVRILFTHLNHSNPALEPDSAERARVEAAGFGIAREGDEFGL